ncbi:hypothetical protein EVAR_38363_1 [Eumeta japonica]|uniref:Uncharacterized protein n=1 Tax=Eumeta variegata TaxID=151549 RepID=A0A4C1Y0F9_EUMVA|nr:hypothetical protein EVAR_38363_1 [Eumeta japonica]
MGQRGRLGSPRPLSPAVRCSLDYDCARAGGTRAPPCGRRRTASFVRISSLTLCSDAIAGERLGATRSAVAAAIGTARSGHNTSSLHAHATRTGYNLCSIPRP